MLLGKSWKQLPIKERLFLNQVKLSLLAPSADTFKLCSLDTVSLDVIYRSIILELWKISWKQPVGIQLSK